MPKNLVKLLLNLILMAGHAIPRGGSDRVVVVTGEAERPTFTLSAKGHQCPHPAHAEAHARRPYQGITRPTPTFSQPIYAGLLAAAAGFMAVSVTKDSDVVVFERGRNQSRPPRRSDHGFGTWRRRPSGADRRRAGFSRRQAFLCAPGRHDFTETGYSARSSERYAGGVIFLLQSPRATARGAWIGSDIEIGSFASRAILFFRSSVSRR